MLHKHQVTGTFNMLMQLRMLQQFQQCNNQQALLIYFHPHRLISNPLFLPEHRVLHHLVQNRILGSSGPQQHSTRYVKKTMKVISKFFNLNSFKEYVRHLVIEIRSTPQPLKKFRSSEHEQ
eukprot:NODE_63_length_26141_cov_1.022656.p25 type:complete len:121 gc:universal NODE_63_length_26141_cov_1.022656:9145-8783(-)